MLVRYHGASSPLGLVDGELYEALSIEKGWYRVVDETEEDYLYPPECFEVVRPNDGTVPTSE